MIIREYTSKRSTRGGLEAPAVRGIRLTVFTAWAKTRSNSLEKIVKETSNRLSLPFKMLIFQVDDWRGQIGGRECDIDTYSP